MFVAGNSPASILVWTGELCDPPMHSEHCKQGLCVLSHKLPELPTLIKKPKTVRSAAVKRGVSGEAEPAFLQLTP